MGILELIEQFEVEFYPISDEKKSLLAKQPLPTVIDCLSLMHLKKRLYLISGILNSKMKFATSTAFH